MTPEQKWDILTFYIDWSGGFHPSESHQVEKFLEEAPWKKTYDYIPAEIADLIEIEAAMPTVVASMRKQLLQMKGLSDEYIRIAEHVFNTFRVLYDTNEELCKAGEELRGWLANGTIWMGGLSSAIHMSRMGHPHLGLDRYDVPDADVFLRWVQIANARLGNWNRIAGDTTKYKRPLKPEEDLTKVRQEAKENIEWHRNTNAILKIKEKYAHAPDKGNLREKLLCDNRVERHQRGFIREKKPNVEVVFDLGDGTILDSDEWVEVYKDLFGEDK